jgi:hypothetical protein
VTLFVSVRLTRQLNAMINNQTDAARAATSVRGEDVAHHVVDPSGLTGLDPLRATSLLDALPRLVELGRSGWLLAVPTPGRLGPLRGPAEFNRAALAAGSTVLAMTGGLALVPHRVGRAVQWRVHAAELPAPPPSPSEAERTLSETILTAGRILERLDVAGGPAPDSEPELGPAPGYPARQLHTAERAARLLVACGVALESDGASLTSYEVEARGRELRTVRAAAVDALCSAAMRP